MDFKNSRARLVIVLIVLFAVAIGGYFSEIITQYNQVIRETLFDGSFNEYVVLWFTQQSLIGHMAALVVGLIRGMGSCGAVVLIIVAVRWVVTGPKSAKTTHRQERIPA